MVWWETIRSTCSAVAVSGRAGAVVVIGDPGEVETEVCGDALRHLGNPYATRMLVW